MIDIKTEKEIGYMAAAGKILASCHKEIRKLIKPGITTMEIDRFAEKYMRDHGATLSRRVMKVSLMQHVLQ